MRLTIRRARQLLLAGLAVALLSGIGFAAPVAAEPDHSEGVPEAVSLSRAEEPLPGGDSTVPVAALALLLVSTGLGWVVRRSAPATAAVAPVLPDALAPVTDLSPHRQPAGTRPTPVSNPAAA